MRAVSSYNRRGTVHFWIPVKTPDLARGGFMRPICGHPTREQRKNLDSPVINDPECENCKRRVAPKTSEGAK